MKAFIRKNPPRFWFLAGFAFIVVATAIAFGAKYYAETGLDPNVLAYIGDQKITIEDYKKFSFGMTRLGTPETPLYDESLTREVVFNAIAERAIIEDFSRDNNIVIDDADVTKALLLDDPNYEKNSVGKAEIFSYKKYALLKTAVMEYVGGDFSGKYILTRQDLYNSVNEVEQNKNTAYIAKSEARAKELIQDLYSQLTSGKINFDQAIKIEKKDPLIGESAPTVNISVHSGPFNSDEYSLRAGVFTYDAPYEKVKNTEVNTITEPFEVTAPNNAKIGWAIMLITKKSGLGQNYTSWLNTKKNSSEYKLKIINDYNGV